MDDIITIVVDTREQEPYSFSSERFLTRRHALPAGDYSIAGSEHMIAVERKTLEDFVHTLIRQRERFRNELRLLQCYDFACIVVEANLEDVMKGAYRCGAHPASVVGATLSIIIDYGIPIYFCSNRQCACRFVEEFLLRYYRRFQNECQAQSQTSISEFEEK